MEEGNPQAAQACFEGSYCLEGTKDPTGDGKCSEGYYCPPGSSEQIPADMGYFAEG